MSTHKTKIEEGIVAAFLQKKFGSVEDMAFVAGGEGSQAFEFKTAAGEYIMRINKEPEGFEKDAYAYGHFCSSGIPIPAIIETGTMENGLAYAISERAAGTRVDLLPAETRAAIAPELFKTLDAIRAADIAAGSGFGRFDASGNADYPSWRASFSALDAWRASMAAKPGMFPLQVEESIWNDVRREIDRLLPYCPEDRSLFHGDFGFDNAFSDGTKITAVIDWGNAGYGDFLYDGAWLGYWSRYGAHRIDAKAHYAASGAALPHLDERMRCYELHIGLGGLMFFAYSQQPDKYEFNKKILLALLAE